MQSIKDFLEEKKRKMTIKAFDTIIEEKKEKLGGMIQNNKREVAIGASVMAGLIVLGLLSTIILFKGDVNYGKFNDYCWIYDDGLLCR